MNCHHKSNTELEVLSLGYNNLGTEFAESLLKNMCNSYSKLKEVYLNGNQIQEAEVDEIAEACSFNMRITYINLNGKTTCQ